MTFSTRLFSSEGIILSVVALGLMVFVYEYKIRRKPAKKASSPRSTACCPAGDNIYPKPLVICGPSGVGKGTLLGRLFKDYPAHFSKSISHTTRAPRQGEVNGVHYHFTTVKVMEQQVKDSMFVEHAVNHGQMYGTSKSSIEAARASGKVCVLEVDVQGAQAIRAAAIESNYFFIHPPTFQDLHDRLVQRGTETPEKIQIRLATAKAELSFAESSDLFENRLVNRQLEECYQELVNRLHQLYPHLSQPFCSNHKSAKTSC